MAVTSEEFPVNKQGISGEHIEELEKIQELDSFRFLWNLRSMKAAAFFL